MPTKPAKGNVEPMYAVVNGRVVLPSSTEDTLAIVVASGKVIAIDETAALPKELPMVDAGGRLVTPGLIDIHIHGAQGYTFNEPTYESYDAITRVNASRGVTALLATTATAPIADLLACLRFARSWVAEPRAGAQVLGVHVEGPYFSLEQAGAQDPANLLVPTDATVNELLTYHDVIRMMTFAPELPGATELTRRLVGMGIIPAAGHSSAREEDLLAPMQAGLGHMIHIWSGQSTTVREGPWRKPGLLEVTLARDDITAEMIADNRHLPPTLMKLAYKCIGPDRLCVISDATSGAGLEDGARFHMGQMEYVVGNGVGMMLDGSAFAGSTTLLNQMLPVLVDVVGVPVHEAVRMASLTPARVIGAASRKGSLEPGKDADIVIFGDDFVPWRVAIGGRWLGDL